jgi:hypothetical protein
MAKTDDYYQQLFSGVLSKEGLAGSPTVATEGGGLLSKAGSKLKGMKNLKGVGAQLLGFMVLSKLLEARNRAADQGLQRENIEAQTAMTTPENLYYQAAQPRAEQEAAEARSALMQQITGGVLGPSLPTGVRRIGG